MGNRKIEWDGAQYWDKPWNPVIGCKPVSPACENCYAREMVRRFNMTGVEGAKAFEPVFKENVKNPPRKGVVFCGNMTDLFGDWVAVEDGVDFIGKTLGYVDKATYLWLTKRPFRMCQILDKGRVFLKSDDDCDFRFSDCEMGNQYFGFTAENQEWYDFRFSHWRPCKPEWAKGWLSVEPLLGPIDLHLEYAAPETLPFQWIVVGCESGAKRRPCEMDWVRSIVSQATAREIPVFVKQLDINGKCERNINLFPEDLQIRQVPWEHRDGVREVK